MPLQDNYSEAFPAQARLKIVNIQLVQYFGAVLETKSDHINYQMNAHTHHMRKSPQWLVIVAHLG